MSKTQAKISVFCQKHKPYLPDFVKITTDARIRRMPAPDIIVSFSANTKIPIRVATIGSIVAMIPALLASTLSRPRV